MPSALDRQLDEAIAALTGVGGRIETIGPPGRAQAVHLPATLPGFLRYFCGRHGRREALVAGPERLSFADLDLLSERGAAALAGGWGVVKGDRVAIAMANSPAWIVCYMAALKAGAIATLINHRWEPRELTGALALAEPVLVIADPARAERIRAADPAVRIVTLAAEGAVGEALAPLVAARPGPLPEVTPEDDATILFTSGSTRAARGAVSTHRAVTTAAYSLMTQAAALRQVLVAAGTPPADPVTLIAVPLFHVTGSVALLLSSIALGRRMVLMPRWETGEALRLIAAERVTHFVGPPTMSLDLTLHPDRAAHDLSSLAEIVAGGAARPVAHVARLRAAFPDGHPSTGYGLTETNGIGCANIRANYLAKPGAAGRPHRPFVDVAVIGADGAPVPSGTDGEIAILSRANIRGYWRDAAGSAAAFTADGYLRTGDLGFIDADGHLTITGRIKDVILRGGENISAAEVEAALYAHPAIVEACVFALPHARLGECPGAVIHGTGGIEAEAILAVLTTIARYKRPVRIWQSAEPLPKLGSGKIDRLRVRALYGG